jgi:multidrug resistance efflux pump
MEETRLRIDGPRTNGLRAPKDTASRASISSAAGPEKSHDRWYRVIRWLIGGAMLAAAGWLVAPTILFRTSVRATVTAPVVAIGVRQPGLVRGTPPVVGSSVVAGQSLFEVETATMDLRPSERIRSEIESIRRTADALRAEIAELDRLKVALSRHFTEYKDARIAVAEKEAAEEIARVNASAARLKTADGERRLHRRLFGRGVGSNVELARAENAFLEASHELEVAREAAAGQQLQLDAARRGLFVGEADGGQDRVASRQRCDELEIQQSGLRARLAELDAHLQGEQSQLASEQRYLAGCRVSIVAPISGVVWSSTVVSGSEAVPGVTVLEIVDPVRSRIDAIFKEVDAERVREGAVVRARLLGSPRIFSGRVVRLAGPGAIDSGTVGDSSEAALSPGMFRAIIDLDQQPTGGDPKNRYHVGRPATVWIYR